MTEKQVASICQFYKKEIQEVLERENISDLSLKYYPPVCYFFPHMKTESGEIPEKIKDYSEMTLVDSCLLYKQEHNSYVSKCLDSHKHFGSCLQMLASDTLLDHYSKDGGYLISPGWLDHWKRILKNWGFDQQTARAFFKECSKRIVFLDTGVEPDAEEKVSAFAKYLDLPHQIVPVGIDYFRLNILTKLSIWKAQQQSIHIKQAQEQAADYALAFDMLTNLSKTSDEKDLINELLSIYTQLFSPKELYYVSVVEGKSDYHTARPLKNKEDRELINWIFTAKEPYKVEISQDGFFLRIHYQNELIGGIAIKRLSFPKYLSKYLNLGLNISPIVGLAISDLRNINKIEEREALLNTLASTDSLTGLYNRRYLMNEAEREFARVKRFGSSLSALMMDIDHFKSVNDTFGHKIGDEVLIEFARLLSQNLRKTDILARLGGDEFIILLPETNSEMAMNFAERLKHVLAKFSVTVDEKVIKITTSMGVAQLADDTQSFDEFLVNCDRALYLAKNKGRNRIENWEEK